MQPHAWQAITEYQAAAGLIEGPLFRRVHAVGTRPHAGSRQLQDQRLGATRLSYTGLYALLQERFLRAGFVDTTRDGLAEGGMADTTSTGAVGTMTRGRRVYGAKVSPPRLALHSLRHTHITLAIRGGASLPVVQKGARHQNPQTTMRYVHDMDALDDAAGDYVKL